MSLNNNYEFSAYKYWLYWKAIEILTNSKSNSSIISFPEVFRKFSIYFHFNKLETRLFLKELEKRKFVKIIPFRGVQILARPIFLKQLRR
jgi:hypothetical protein